ncbi:MAG TPA: hypothetical protein VIH99_00645 [Bdellovibrionota bacterium]|jgi:hypothetical protein
MKAAKRQIEIRVPKIREVNDLLPEKIKVKRWLVFLRALLVGLWILFLRRPVLVRQQGPDQRPLEEHEWKPWA